MSDTPDTVDLSKMDEDQLRARYAQLSEAIATLEAEPKTVETGQAIPALRIERNAVATAVNEMRALAAETVDDVSITDALSEAVASDDTPDTADEAPADEAAADEPEPEATPEPEVATDLGSGDTATPQDVTTPNNGGTTVAETPDNQPTPAADDVAGVIAEAEAIVSDAPAPVTAGLNLNRPLGGGSAAVLDRPTVSHLAKGGQTTFAEGTPLDMTALGQVISEIQAGGRDNGSGIVAALPGFDVTQGMPHEVLTSRMSAADATALIDETVAAHKEARKARLAGQDIDAVTAAICTPLDIIREVPECGVTLTPFSDIFPQRGIGRLGFQYFPQMALIDTDPNVNIWTDEDQDAVDEADTATWKPAPLIECLPAVPVTAEELVAAAQVDNSTQISQPEQVVQFMHKLAVQRSRRREQYLQGKFDALASGYTLTGGYGAMQTILETGELLERLVYGERLDEGDYDLVLEPGHMRKLCLDESARVYGDTLAQRKAAIIAKIKDELGVGDVVVLRDFRTGGGYAALNEPGEAATAMPRLFDSNRVRFVPTSAFIFGATGEDSTGWETDPQLARQNRMQWFSKEWLLLAKHGCHPAAYIDVTSCASGARAAGIEPVDCTSQDS